MLYQMIAQREVNEDDVNDSISISSGRVEASEAEPVDRVCV